MTSRTVTGLQYKVGKTKFCFDILRIYYDKVRYRSYPVQNKSDCHNKENCSLCEIKEVTFEEFEYIHANDLFAIVLCDSALENYGIRSSTTEEYEIESNIETKNHKEIYIIEKNGRKYLNLLDLMQYIFVSYITSVSDKLIKIFDKDGSYKDTVVGFDIKKIVIDTDVLLESKKFGESMSPIEFLVYLLRLTLHENGIDFIQGNYGENGIYEECLFITNSTW